MHLSFLFCWFFSILFFSVFAVFIYIINVYVYYIYIYVYMSICGYCYVQTTALLKLKDIYYSLQMQFINLFYLYIVLKIQHLKLVSAIFYQIFISSNDRPSKTMKKCFLFHLKSSFCSRGIQIFVIFSLFQSFQIQKGKWKWNNLWCHKLACINLQIKILE